jgi:hypothetical protein
MPSTILQVADQFTSNHFEQLFEEGQRRRMQEFLEMEKARDSLYDRARESEKQLAGLRELRFDSNWEDLGNKVDISRTRHGKLFQQRSIARNGGEQLREQRFLDEEASWILGFERALSRVLEQFFVTDALQAEVGRIAQGSVEGLRVVLEARLEIARQDRSAVFERSQMRRNEQLQSLHFPSGPIFPPRGSSYPDSSGFSCSMLESPASLMDELSLESSSIGDATKPTWRLPLPGRTPSPSQYISDYRRPRRHRTRRNYSPERRSPVTGFVSGAINHEIFSERW